MTAPFESGLRERVARNRTAQDTLAREIAALDISPQKRAAEARLLALRTDLLALNVEMQIRIQQQAGQT